MRRARPLLGTFVEISVAGGRPAAMEAAVEAAFAAIERVHRLMSFHDPASDVSRLNRDAARTAVAIDAWTYQVIAAAIDLQRGSDGVFDITMAPALQRLGLLPATGDPAPPGQSSRDAIALLPDRRVRFRDPATRIDLGGIAKGFAVDRAVETLRAHGVTRGLVNAGGDLAAFGPATESVHIRDPRDPRRIIARIDIADAALASSGGCIDPFGTAGVAAPAVIDTRTGAPTRAVAGATVRAPSCMIADALTKVVMVAAEAAAPLLDRHGASAMLVSPDGNIRVSPSWRDARAA